MLYSLSKKWLSLSEGWNMEKILFHNQWSRLWNWMLHEECGKQKRKSGYVKTHSYTREGIGFSWLCRYYCLEVQVIFVYDIFSNEFKEHSYMAFSSHWPETTPQMRRKLSTGLHRLGPYLWMLINQLMKPTIRSIC